MNQTTLPDYTLAPEQVPLVPSLSLPDEQRAQLKAQIRAQLKALNAVLVAHYYVDVISKSLLRKRAAVLLIR